MKNKQLQIRCTEEQKELIEKLARLENRSLSNYILNLVEKESEKLKVIDSMESFEIRADGGIDVVEKKEKVLYCKRICERTSRKDEKCCFFCDRRELCDVKCSHCHSIEEVEKCKWAISKE